MSSLSLRKKTNSLALVLPIISLGLFLLFFMSPSTGYMDNGPEVWIEIQDPPGLVGNNITITIGITNVVELYGTEFITEFDKNKLQVVDSNLENSEIEIVDGDCAQPGPNLADNDQGVIRHLSSNISTDSFTGDCIIAHIPFSIDGPVTDDSIIELDFQDFILVDSEGTIIAKNQPSGPISIALAPLFITPTATSTVESSATLTSPNTATPTGTSTNTPTETPTEVPSSTHTPSPTNTPIGATSTSTNTPSPTATSTNTPSPTSTSTNTPSPTNTQTTNTPSPTSTSTNTPSPTSTSTNTPSPTSTSTNTRTPTNTPVVTTPSATNIPEITPSVTNTPVITPSSTNTPVTPSTTNTPVSPTSTAIVTPGPGGMNLKVAHIEVSQAIQDMNNSVPMVANRPAIARVYIDVQNGAGSVPDVTANLHASRNGIELANSPISSFNTGNTINAPLAANREVLEHTLNFQLPASWITEGDITIWAEVNPDEAVDESNYADNDSSTLTLTFGAVPKPEVVLIPIAYQKDGTGEIHRPDLNGSNNLGLGMLQETYPIDQVLYTIHSEYLFTGDMKTTQGWLDLLDEIGQLRLLERPNESLYAGDVMPKYYGVLPMEATLYGGLAYRPGTTGLGLVNQRDVAAHEIGHNIGLSHVGTCGGPAGSDEGYPYNDGEIGNVGVNVYTQELLGLTQPHRDIMAYCWPKWISDYHYKQIRDTLLTVSRQPRYYDDQETGPALLVSGQLNIDQTSGSLNHAVPDQSNNIVQPSEEGEYRLELLDSEENLLFSYAFDPIHIEFPPKQVDGTEVNEDEVANFGFALPQVDNLGYIRLFKGDIQLDSLTASPKPEITASFEEDSKNPNELIISWEATDSAHINIRYSADNGETWQMVALERLGTSFTLSKSQLLASSNGLIEVVASDNTEISIARLEVGKISNKKPKAEISGINSGVFTGTLTAGDPIVFHGLAFDLEDGIIESENMTWTVSSTDILVTDPDIIVSGPQLLIADGLKGGSYQITFTVTDKNGNEASTSIDVKIHGSNGIFLPLMSRSTISNASNPVRSVLHLPLIRR